MSELNKTKTEQLYAAPATQEAEQNNNDKAKSTPGKWGHWALTYLGGDWLLNSAVGVGFTYFTARTGFGQKYYVEPVSKGIRALLKPFFKQAETLEKAVGGGRDFLSIMVGGTAINPILTRLESHENKKAISKAFDTAIYGKERVEHDPKFQEAYDAIDKEPIKDMKSVWVSRLIALAPLYAAATNPRSYAYLKHNDTPIIKYLSFDRISNFTRTAAEKIGIRPAKMMNTTMKNVTTGEVTSNWKALHDYIGFDYGLTVYYAILHAISFSAVAKLFQTRRDNRTCRNTLEQAGIPLSQTKDEAGLQETAPFQDAAPAQSEAAKEPVATLAVTNDAPTSKIQTREMHGVLAPAPQLAAATV